MHGGRRLLAWEPVLNLTQLYHLLSVGPSGKSLAFPNLSCFLSKMLTMIPALHGCKDDIRETKALVSGPQYTVGANSVFFLS